MGIEDPENIIGRFMPGADHIADPGTVALTLEPGGRHIRGRTEPERVITQHLEPVLPQGYKVAFAQEISIPELTDDGIFCQQPLQILVLTGQNFLESDDIGHFRLDLLKDPADTVSKIIDAVNFGIGHIPQIVRYNFHLHGISSLRSFPFPGQWPLRSCA